MFMLMPLLQRQQPWPSEPQPQPESCVCYGESGGGEGLDCSEPQTGGREDDACKAFPAKALGLTLTSVR